MADFIETASGDIDARWKSDVQTTGDSGKIRETVHNFRNLISGITLLSQLQMMDLEESSGLRATFERIVDACKDADCLCKQMLNSDQHEVIRDQISLPNVIRDLAPLFSTYLPQGGEMELTLEKCLTIQADGKQLRQLVLNVVKNACEAMTTARAHLVIKTGSVHSDDIWMSEGALAGRSQKGAYSFLEVSDTGCGMSEPSLRRLFQNPVSTKQGGHGLGMSSVLRSVLDHNGMIHVTSREQSGTIVRVFFPAIPKVLDELEVRRRQGVSAPLHVAKCLPLIHGYTSGVNRISTALRTTGLLGFMTNADPALAGKRPAFGSTAAGG